MYMNYFSHPNKLDILQRLEVIEEFDLRSTTQLGRWEEEEYKEWTLRWKNFDEVEDEVEDGVRLKGGVSA